jgi:uncharacterized protein (TIGR02145 family)
VYLATSLIACFAVSNSRDTRNVDLGSGLQDKPSQKAISVDLYNREIDALNLLLEEEQNNPDYNIELRNIVNEGKQISDTLGVCFESDHIPTVNCDDLIKFQQKYTQTLHGIYRLRLLKAKLMTDRRKKIQVCSEALGYFLNPVLAPEMIAEMSVSDFSSVPFTDNTSKATWITQKQQNLDLMLELSKRISRWAESCSKSIFDQTSNDNSGERGEKKLVLNGYFINTANERIKPLGYSVDENGFYYDVPWSFNVEINGIVVEQYKLNISCKPHIPFSKTLLGWNWDSKSKGEAEISDYKRDIKIVKQKNGQSLEYQKFTDSRDRKSYKVIKISGKRWFAENLNYKTLNSSCYANDTSNCVKFGHLYTYKEAKNACPNGWHLPNLSEWKALIWSNQNHGDEENGKSIEDECRFSTSHQSDRIFNNVNLYGFIVNGSGSKNDGEFHGKNEYARFHTSDYSPESGDQEIIEFQKGGETGEISSDVPSVNTANSIRCVEN